jgi:hypothetical protein
VAQQVGAGKGRGAAQRRDVAQRGAVVRRLAGDQHARPLRVGREAEQRHALGGRRLERGEQAAPGRSEAPDGLARRGQVLGRGGAQGRAGRRAGDACLLPRDRLLQFVGRAPEVQCECRCRHEQHAARPGRGGPLVQEVEIELSHARF